MILEFHFWGVDENKQFYLKNKNKKRTSTNFLRFHLGLEPPSVLLRVFNDVFLATDSGRCFFLVLLGLTGVLRLHHNSEVNDLERP